MKERKKTTKKELMETEMRGKDELICAKEIFLLQENTKHSSGFRCMSAVATTPNGRRVKVGGCCDVFSFSNCSFRIDCEYQSKVFRLFSSNRFFITPGDMSDIFIVDENTAIRLYGKEAVEQAKKK